MRPASRGHFNHMAIIITLLNPKKQPSRLASSEAMKQRPPKCEATMQRLPESEASVLRPPTSEAKRKGLSENEAKIKEGPNIIIIKISIMGSFGSFENVKNNFGQNKLSKKSYKILTRKWPISVFAIFGP